MYVKAFETDEILPFKGSLGIEVCSVEVDEHHLYIGTMSGQLCQYSLKRNTDKEGNISFECFLQRKKPLFRNPIEKLTKLSGLDLLVAQCGQSINLISMRSLSTLPPPNKTLFTNISAYFCLDYTTSDQQESSDISAEVTITRKRTLLNLQISRSQLFVDKEIQLPGPITVFARQDSIICAAFKNEYKLIDLVTHNITTLFPFDDHTVPYILVLKNSDGSNCGSEPEFLLGVSATETVSLGMFVNSLGGTTRPPLQFQANPISVAFDFPYVIASFENGIEIHSIIDAQHKQTMAVDTPEKVQNTPFGVVLRCSNSLCSLRQLSVTSQVYSLLQDGAVDQGLELAETFLKDSTLTPSEKVSIHQAFLVQAGHVCMASGDFEKSLNFFENSAASPSEVIILYGLEPNSGEPGQSRETNCLVYSVVRGKPGKLKEGYELLNRYLLKTRNSKIITEKEESIIIDTALLKLAVLLENKDALYDFIHKDNFSAYEDCEQFLLHHQKYSALANYHASKNKAVKSLNMWKRLEENDLFDNDYDNLAPMTTYLCDLNNNHLVYKYVEWMVKINNAWTYQILCSQTIAKRFSKRETVAFTEKISKLMMWLYLNFVVIELKSERKEYHSQLALVFSEYCTATLTDCKNNPKKKGDIESFININNSQKKDPDYYAVLRQTFQNFLNESESYDFQMIFDCIKESELFREHAILFGKMGKHNEALNILVHTLDDPEGAQIYCSKGNSEEREKKYYILLTIYLVSSSNEKNDRFSGLAIDLLNMHGREFDSVMVLEVIPACWSIQTLENFLRTATRYSTSKSRQAKITRKLSQTQKINTANVLYTLERQSVAMLADRKCSICYRKIVEGAFARYPNGNLAHVDCENRSHGNNNRANI